MCRGDWMIVMSGIAHGRAWSVFGLGRWRFWFSLGYIVGQALRRLRESADSALFDFVFPSWFRTFSFPVHPKFLRSSRNFHLLKQVFQELKLISFSIRWPSSYVNKPATGPTMPPRNPNKGVALRVLIPGGNRDGNFFSLCRLRSIVSWVNWDCRWAFVRDNSYTFIYTQWRHHGVQAKYTFLEFVGMFLWFPYVLL